VLIKCDRSIVVEETRSLYLLDTCVGIAFFFFSFQIESTPDQMLLALIKQLCRRKRDIPEHIVKLYTERTSDARPPRSKELEECFQKTIGCFDQVFLVVDAMDECKKDYRKGLLSYIVCLFQSCPGKLKLFVTSRPEADIMHEFGSGTFKTIRIEATKVNADMASYVKHALDTRHHLYYALHTDFNLREQIERALLKEANGM
jgi:hypothetical protein